MLDIFTFLVPLGFLANPLMGKVLELPYGYELGMGWGKGGNSAGGIHPCPASHESLGNPKMTTYRIFHCWHHGRSLKHSVCDSSAPSPVPYHLGVELCAKLLVCSGHVLLYGRDIWVRAPF